MNIAIFPGSFDPITFGHLDVIKRSAKLFDKVYVVILENSNKQSFLPLDVRLALLQESVKDLANVVVDYDHTTTINYAHKVKAKAIIRGIRSVKDYEYELNIASVNQMLDSDIETVLLYTKAQYAHISSSIVKEFLKYQEDISMLVEPHVVKVCLEKVKADE